MRKVLIVAYEFPPKGWSGVYRTMKFARYLPDFGWLPVVLTTDKSYHPQPMDPSLLEEVAHVHVECANMLTHEDFIQLWRQVGTVMWPFLRIFGKDPEWFAQGMRWRYGQWLCPDYACTWIGPAIFRGLRMIRQHKVHIIYATAPPFSSLVIGMILSMLTSRPFVADFRDLWIDNFDRRPAAFWRSWMDPWLESLVISRASKVITTTHSNTRTLVSRYGTVLRDKFITIFNGYDTVDLPPPVDTQEPNKRMTICYVGSLYGKRTPEPFLEALDAILKEGLVLREKLCVRFVGCVEQFADQFQSRVHSGVIETTGVVNHRRATKYLVSADVLLLIMEPGAEAVTSGKIFEYFASGKPILACVPINGEAALLLRRRGDATIVDVNDVDEIKKALVDLHTQWLNGGIEAKRDDEFIRQFERRELTIKLVEVFDGCVPT